MHHEISRSDEALRDLEGQVDYFNRDNVEVANRFIAAAETTFRFLLENHDVGQLCHFRDPETEGLRVWPIQKFRNHLVFYRSAENGIMIERVLHGARDIEALFGVGD